MHTYDLTLHLDLAWKQKTKIDDRKRAAARKKDRKTE